jgi:hypothetical protein
MRAYRRANPDKARLVAERQYARHRAALAVARRYPGLWEAAYLAECEERGIEPYGSPGRPSRERRT